MNVSGREHVMQTSEESVAGKVLQPNEEVQRTERKRSGWRTTYGKLQAVLADPTLCLTCAGCAGWEAGRVGGLLTWNDIASIHGILVLNEAEAIHKLDLGDLAGAMGVEVVLNIGLSS